jgi:hypothetical protein
MLVYISWATSGRDNANTANGCTRYIQKNIIFGDTTILHYRILFPGDKSKALIGKVVVMNVLAADKGDAGFQIGSLSA